MTLAWGALPLLLFASAAAAGQLWIARYERRTGRALLFFVPYEPWSRARNPVLFKLRQVVNYLAFAFFLFGALSFLVLFLGLLNAPNP